MDRASTPCRSSRREVDGDDQGRVVCVYRGCRRSRARSVDALDLAAGRMARQATAENGHHAGTRDARDRAAAAAAAHGAANRSAGAVAQRGPVDLDGVALMAQPAEQRVDERLVAEEVGPLG